MMEPFSPPAACFFLPSIPHPQAPLRKGLGKVAFNGLVLNFKFNEKLIYFLLPPYITKITRPPSAMVAKMASIAVSWLP